MKRFCPNCGTELKPGASFCPHCGFKLTQNSVNQNKPQETQPAPKPVEEKPVEKPVEPTEPKPVEKPVEQTIPKKEPASAPKKVQVFCPNCGHPLKPGAEFCSNCGYNLKTKQVPKSVPQPQTNNVPSSQPVQHKPMKTSTKVLLSIIGVLVVALIGFYAWGSSYYSMDNQVDRITSKLPDPSQDLSPYVTADSASVKVTKDAVKPLQEYYKEHQPAVTKLNSNLKADIGNSNISLVKNGRYWLLFPKYKLQVKTYQPQIVTNHANSVVKVNGQNIGSLSKNSKGYYKKMGLIFPGKYHVVVTSQVAGRKLSATSTANIFGN
ncbi:MAG: zinc-ribbon domain-containing protein, partial [Lactobacillus sp.]